MKTINYIKSEELKTSQQWQEIFPKVKVLDPDGWDRTDFQFSWFEENINIGEYNKRLLSSTIQGKIK